MDPVIVITLVMGVCAERVMSTTVPAMTMISFRQSRSGYHGKNRFIAWNWYNFTYRYSCGYKRKKYVITDGYSTNVAPLIIFFIPVQLLDFYPGTLFVF